MSIPQAPAQGGMVSLGPRALGGAAGPAHWRGSEREGPPGRAGSCGTICYAGGGARPSVCLQTRLCAQEKQGPSSRRVAPLPAQEEGSSGARGWRHRQGLVCGGRSQPVRSPLHTSTPAGAPTHPQRLEVHAPPPLTSRGTLSRPWEQQYPRKTASRMK